MQVENITEESELDELLAEPGKLVVECYADWCAPCQDMEARIEKWASQYINVKFVKVNVDEADELAEIFCIESIPTFIFYENGQEVFKQVDGDAQILKDEIKKFCK